MSSQNKAAKPSAIFGAKGSLIIKTTRRRKSRRGIVGSEGKSKFRATARCRLYYNRDLGKGDAGALPLHPSGLWRSRIHYHFTGAPCTVWPLHHHSGERSCFPRNPHDPRENSLSLWTPIANSIEANLVQFGYAPREPSAPPVEPLDQGAYSLPLWNRRPVVPARLRAKARPWQSRLVASANPKCDFGLAGIQPDFTFQREVKGLDL